MNNNNDDDNNSNNNARQINAFILQVLFFLVTYSHVMHFNIYIAM